MKFDVEFRLPSGDRISVAVDGESHMDAAHEAVFDPEMLSDLSKTGQTKFSAKVKRHEDNATRMVLVEIAASQDMSEHVLSVAAERGRCSVCGREKVPEGYSFDVPEGAVCCQECGIPLKKDNANLKGWHEVPETSEQLGVCGVCEQEAHTTECEGVFLCETCKAELYSESKTESKAEAEKTGPRFYLVIFGSHLEPGHGDRVQLRIQAETPKIALSGAELAIETMPGKGAEWLKAYYEVGLTPTIDMCEAPSEHAPEPVAEDEYEVVVYLGSSTLKGVIVAPNAQRACVAFVAQEVADIAPVIEDATSVAASAKNVDNGDDVWGPGVVSVPIERVTGFSEMTSEQRAGAMGRLGIEPLTAGPAMGFE